MLRRSPTRPPVRAARARGRAYASRPALLRATAIVIALIATTMSSLPGSAASTSVQYELDVASITVLDTIGCPTGDATRTVLGSVMPGIPSVTDDDCDIVFGASNDTATLRVYQSDGRGDALAQPGTTKTNIGSVQERVIDLDMGSATIGWSVGQGAGRVRRTDDGGSTWVVPGSLPGPLTGGTIRAVSAPSATDVWITKSGTSDVVRGRFGVPTGGAWNWNSVPLSGTTPRSQGVTALDNSTAWVAGSTNSGATSAIWRTINGGTAWTNVHPGGTGSTYTDIKVAPGTTKVFATTQDGNIQWSSDGTTFVATGSPNSGVLLTAVDAIDANNAIVVGSQGQIYTTTNGGTNWTARSTDGVNLKGVSYLADGTAWAWGERGMLKRSTDHGVTWTTLQSRIESATISAGEALSATSFQLGTHGAIFAQTSDTAATWTASATPSAGTNWAEIAGVDGATMWRAGSLGRIEATTDGTTWSLQTIGTSDALHAITALDRQRVVAVGANGAIVRTTNGGTSWSTITSGTTVTLRAVASYGDRVWAVGDGGTLLRSLDGGATFSALTSGTTRIIHSIDAWSATELLTGNDQGTIRRSTDGGVTWSTLGSAPSDRPVLSIDAIPGTNVAWMAWGSNVSRTLDRGATWNNNAFPSGVSPQDVSGVDGSAAWIGGAFGGSSILYRTLNAGGTLTEITGGDNVRMINGVLAFDAENFTAVGDGNLDVTMSSTSLVPDYDGASASWAGTGMFGICLREAVGAVSTWPTTGSCPTTDGTNWRGLPDHGGLAAASVASTGGPGTLTASLRFGIKPPLGTTPGEYRAPVTFQVTAPG